jgi:hypothetical protein
MLKSGDKMNTFLPYPDFQKSAKCLDCKRLGKQRVEAWQIYLALTKENYGWKNHPIVKMWKGHESVLLYYGLIVSNEWYLRGYKDNMTHRFLSELCKEGNLLVNKPFWLGNKKFHSAMRSNLLRKNKEWYSQFGWKEPDNLPYIWFK